MKIPIEYRRSFPWFAYRSSRDLYRDHLNEQVRRAVQFRDCMTVAAAKGWPIEIAVIVDGVACVSSMVDSKGVMSKYIAEAACGVVMKLQGQLADHISGDFSGGTTPPGDIAPKRAL